MKQQGQEERQNDAISQIPKGMARAGAILLALAFPARAANRSQMGCMAAEEPTRSLSEEEKWDEVVAYAKKEGEVVIYSSSGTMLKVAEDFAKFYPDIKVKAYDLGSEKTIEKVVREHQAASMRPTWSILAVPSRWCSTCFPTTGRQLRASLPDGQDPGRDREPLLTHVIEAYGVFYNAEAHPQPPIKTIWELTEPQWKGRFSMKSPAGSLTTLMMLAAIVEHSDEMRRPMSSMTERAPALGSASRMRATNSSPADRQRHRHFG